VLGRNEARLEQLEKLDSLGNRELDLDADQVDQLLSNFLNQRRRSVPKGAGANGAGHELDARTEFVQ
jgi:hypothetical protein